MSLLILILKKERNNSLSHRKPAGLTFYHLTSIILRRCCITAITRNSNYHYGVPYLTLFSKNVFTATFNHRLVVAIMGLVFAGVKHLPHSVVKRDIKSQCHFLRFTVFCFATVFFFLFCHVNGFWQQRNVLNLFFFTIWKLLQKWSKIFGGKV